MTTWFHAELAGVENGTLVMQFTRIPCGASSTASDLVSVITAALELAYQTSLSSA